MKMRKRRITFNIVLSSRKRRYSKLVEESNHLDAKSSKLVDKAERENEMKYVMEGNILKQAAALRSKRKLPSLAQKSRN